MSTPWADAEGHFRPEVFARFVTNQLSADERSRFERHLQGCPRCRGMLAVQQRTSRGPNAITLDGSAPAGPTVTGDRTLPLGDLPTVPPPTVPPPTVPPPTVPPPTVPPSGPETPLLELADGSDPTRISSNRVAPIPDPRHNALTHKDLPPTSGQPVIDPLIGRKVGDYVVMSLLARGGMAAVYRGVHPVIGKQVAIKVLLPVSNEHDFAQRMVQEAQTVNAIAHPNIIDIFGAGALPDGRPFLVMEFLDGKSVAELVRTSPRAIPPEVVIGVLEQICSALEAAHAAGVVHRDIKPANVMLTHLEEPVPRVKVVDFGLAKSGNAGPGTAPDVVLGTPGFVSPEQIQGHRASPLSDLYSVGLVGWFMLRGVDPYPRHEHPVATMRRQLNEEPQSLVGQPGVPADLAALVAELCRIDPAGRPKSAGEVRERLASMVSAVPPSVPVGTLRRQALVGERPPVERRTTPAKRRAEPEGLGPLKSDEPPDTLDEPRGPEVTPQEALERPLAPDVTPKQALDGPLAPEVTPKQALPADDRTPLMVSVGDVLHLDSGPRQRPRSDRTVVGAAPVPPPSRSPAVWVWLLLGLALVGAGVATLVWLR